MQELTGQRSKHYYLNKNYITDPLVFGSFRLFQIGRLYCTGQTVVDKHAHIDWYELTIVTHGKGTVITNDQQIPVKQGDIYLSFPCDFHAITSDRQEPLRYDFFSFKTEDASFSEELARIMETHIRPDCRIMRDDVIASLVSGAIAELDRDDRYTKEMIEAGFTQILVRLLRAFSNGGDTEHTRSNATEAEALCYRLMNYIDTHIYTLSGLEELAEVTNYNYSYLSSLFHKTTSGMLTDYYRRRRLETARLLIEEGGLNITEISALLRYSSIYTFSRAFKEFYGVSPSQYKKSITNSTTAIQLRI
jgi:AraC-like DNA-binding protein